MNTTYQRSLLRGVIAATVGGVSLLPVAFPGWTQVVAEIYDSDSKEIEEAFNQFVANPNQGSTAVTIATICPKGVAGTDLQRDCNAVVGAARSGDTVDAATALAEITADQIAVPTNSALQSVSVQGQNLNTRLAALRSGAVGLSLGGLAMTIDGQQRSLTSLTEAQGGGASADAGGLLASGRLGIFVNGSLGRIDKDRTQNEEGFESDSGGLTAGADYRLSESIILGGAFGWGQTNTDIDASGGSLDTDSYSLSLYGTWYQGESLFIDGIISYGWSDYDQKRNIRYSVPDTPDVNQTASAKFDGNHWNLALNAGYDFSRGALTLGPRIGLEYINADVDGYSERMSRPADFGSGWASRISSQNYESFTSSLGGQFSYALSQDWGVLVPQMQLDWVHEYKDDIQVVNGSYIQDPTNTLYSIRGDAPDSDYFNLQLGLSAQFARGQSAFVYFQKVLDYQDIDGYSVGAGIRLAF